MSGTAHAAEPKKGGHLRVGVGHGSTTDSLDPATFENAFMSNGVGYAINNHIAELGTSGELEPELAESWEASDDAVQWVFKIRPGVEFHNGKTVDADDVVASVNHHRGEDSKSAAKPLLVQLKDIKADGKDTVVVELDGGNADFPFIISDYHIAILPSSEGKVDSTSGVGAGGYSIVNFEPGVRVDFKRHPNYWKEDRAHFDSAEQLSITDVTARTNALTTGEIDVMDRVDIKTLNLLQRNNRRDHRHGALHLRHAHRYAAIRQ
jgi:peptide/nickel transport system substrate-binding protein